VLRKSAVGVCSIQYRLMKTKQGQAMEGHRQT